MPDSIQYHYPFEPFLERNNELALLESWERHFALLGIPTRREYYVGRYYLAVDSRRNRSVWDHSCDFYERSER